MSDIAHSKRFFEQFRAALYDCERATLADKFNTLVHPDCDIVVPQPMSALTGPDALLENAYAPLLDAIPDLERRDTIMLGGEQDGEHWIGCGGNYQGVI